AGSRQGQHQQKLQQKHRQAAAERAEGRGTGIIGCGVHELSVHAAKGMLGNVSAAGLTSMPASISTQAWLFASLALTRMYSLSGAGGAPSVGPPYSIICSWRCSTRSRCCSISSIFRGGGPYDRCGPGSGGVVAA